jgi:mannosylglycerate hydrolase MGH1-like protein
MPPTPEHLRLAAADRGDEPWRHWGPYLAERQWGTVREDYSAGGDAWEYLPHDHARSRAYRWGEDGLAGICDDRGRLCLALALWNGRDAFLKERLFGLTNGQGNHGEDVKELYYYLDATPTHSYLKMLYKYPQRPFPYSKLVEEAACRDREQPEFELLDTGIFDDDRYFDVFVEYAKASPTDILLRVTAYNRGPDYAPLHLLPQLWFRNRWSWRPTERKKPNITAGGEHVIQAWQERLGNCWLYCDGAPELLVCENETNTRRLYKSADARGPFKDAFHDYVVGGHKEALSPDRMGTKAAAHYRFTVPAHGCVEIRLRLVSSRHAPRDEPNAHGVDSLSQAFTDFSTIFNARIREADDFYADLQSEIDDADARLVQRQALAGMIWSKQFYFYDVRPWLEGDENQPPPPEERRHARNSDWKHLNNADVISMPDKWEYPWYAAWDTAFHCLPLALIDPEFAKEQLVLLTREWYMHPSGQIPAYEWNFSDVNPPVHAWAAWRVFQIDRKARHQTHPHDAGDLSFLERVFHKLMLNFTWWVNRKDEGGRNLFQGGFLGLDNIGVFDRSKPLPTGGFINQADGTSWMAMYSLNLMRIALELALHNPVYEDIATKFFEHFLYIAEAMTNIGGNGTGLGLWDDEDDFYYDELNLPEGKITKLKIRSMVGLIPLFAVETLEPDMLERLPGFRRRLEWTLKNRQDLCQLVSRWEEPGLGERRLLSLLRGSRMKKLLRRMLDESEFLSPHGVRALSRAHLDQPYVFSSRGLFHAVYYEPAESRSGAFGGNSNWRGPVWFPVNYLIIESLQKFHHYYGDDFRVECPTGSGNFVTINDVANELSARLSRLFLRDASGRRPAFGHWEKLQRDPNFRDHLLFHEYFHGDNGAGLGASHQTGWTGLIAKLLMPRREEESGSVRP